MVVSKSVRLIEQGQTACNSWRLTLRSQAGRALSLHATSSPANSIAGVLACGNFALARPSGPGFSARPVTGIQQHESTMPVELKSATASDSARIAQLLIDARTAFMPYAPSAHTDEEVRSWVAASMVRSGDVILALASGATVGVMATKQECNCSWITQMTVDPAHVGRRIGSSLLAHALLILRRPILLYTFQANTGARRFYERHGFRAIQFTDGRTNEERCPDVLYELAASPNPVIRVTGRS
jgi:ribosomal protein S18 acetylase RimI-like enzyme